DLDLLVDDGPQPAEGAFGVGPVGQDHAELVTAEPGDRVGVAHVAGQPPGQLGEEAVAAVVAEGVVDLLEAVEVHDGEGDGTAAPPAQLEGGGGPVVEQRAVGQGGEAIVLG